VALRPRRNHSRISSRYGAQALALGARVGVVTTSESVDTPVVVMAGFAAGSVDTPSAMAAFDFDSLRRPGPGTTIPAAFK
jgi:hypothetical protein